MALLTDYITYHRGKRIEATSRTVVIADYFGMIGVGAVLRGLGSTGTLHFAVAK